MSLLQQILETMYIDPELLEELSKDQKEVLFHKMREEQLRRWHTRKTQDFERLQGKKRVPRLKFAPSVFIYEDDDVDKKANEAAKRLEEREKEREAAQMRADEEQARILAEIQIQEEIERQTAEQARKAEELRIRELEEQRKLQEAALRERQAQIEREQYMSMKEARLAAEAEAKAQRAREEAARKLAEERAREEARLEAERKKAEAEAQRQAEAKQQEIYMSMREMREQARKQREMEERQMDQMFQEQESRSKQHEAEQRAAAERARKAAQATENIFKQLEAHSKPAAPQVARATNMARSASLAKRPASPPPTGPGHSNTLPLPPRKGSMADVGARPSKPSSLEDVLHWFRTSEIPRGVGKSATGRWENWFHGPISRPEAERLLKGKPKGAFLLRISTRIWGYTLSFVDSDRYKHFLVDASDGKYSVFGAQSNATHMSLSRLVAFHKKVAVSKTGTMLTEPVGELQGNASLLQVVM
ncbi:uncharacterized protein MONBRDRAFT_30425 [Monosiga brevicollis MX1]|uniref:SH2 domain-containing protein n=1 Tax=Monosiga brevicollis TaxID=81824 RepID=A9VDX4_MONBE|nr:uncharacterized protein MONBRDRAFT_30425 [Monosiga brevicollis MX1]EDQ84294.1 predicted protein [Monosiga brevicollis MX1]|eukprot:XP_001750924.1 hypothetical protein [Monosiga brevicollis MX1]